MTCPNLSDPVIKEEFNKLKKAVGEAQAYDIWNKNNGYYLDKLPTGEDSNIFKDLVAKYGDENTAVKHIATFYSKGYFEAMMAKITRSEHPIAALYENNLNNGLLDLVAQNTTVKNYKELAQIISFIMKENNYTFPIELMPFKDGDLGIFRLILTQTSSNSFYFEKQMKFAPFTHPVYKKNIEEVEHTILHEYIHALTSEAYITNPFFKNDIDSLYETTINMIKMTQGERADHILNSHYGFTKPSEFIAEALSNKSFQLLLKSTPYSKSEKLTILQKFVEYVMELLQPYSDKYGIILDHDSMFDAVMKVVENQILDDFNMSDIVKNTMDYSLDNIKKVMEQHKQTLYERQQILKNVTYTEEDGSKCAKNGWTNAVEGTNWKIVKDFKGQPKHSQGGVDITLSDKGVTIRRGGKDIKAKNGLLIAANSLNSGNSDKPPFDEWYKTVPKNKADTTNYNLRRAYELAPKEQLDAFVNDPKAHLYSAYENKETGEYEFVKSKDHKSIKDELDWYNGDSEEAIDFRSKYDLDKSKDYYKYIPKKKKK